MAVKTPLRPIARRISGVIRAFAAGRGWDQDELAIAGTFDELTERITLYVGSERLIDEKSWNIEIRGALRGEFEDFPGVVDRIGLIVRHVEHLGRIYRDLRLGDDEIDMTELLE